MEYKEVKKYDKPYENKKNKVVKAVGLCSNEKLVFQTRIMVPEDISCTHKRKTGEGANDTTQQPTTSYWLGCKTRHRKGIK